MGKQEVIDCLRKYGDMTSQELSEKIGINRGNVGRALNKLGFRVTKKEIMLNNRKTYLWGFRR